MYHLLKLIASVFYFRQVPLISEIKMVEMLEVRCLPCLLCHFSSCHRRFFADVWTTKWWKWGKWLPRKSNRYKCSIRLSFLQNTVRDSPPIPPQERAHSEGKSWNDLLELDVTPVYPRPDSCDWRKILIFLIDNMPDTIKRFGNVMQLSWGYARSSIAIPTPSRNGCQSYSRMCWLSIRMIL